MNLHKYNPVAQLNALHRTSPKKFAIALGCIGCCVVLWAGILGWGFAPIRLVPELAEWKFLFPQSQHKPVRMPFRKRGVLLRPSTDDAFPMTFVDIDRG